MPPEKKSSDFQIVNGCIVCTTGPCLLRQRTYPGRLNCTARRAPTKDGLTVFAYKGLDEDNDLFYPCNVPVTQ